MQPFKLIGDLKCKICKNYMTTENCAIQLKCGNTLCLKCYENMIKTNAKCPFNEYHDHIDEPKIRNLVCKDILEKIEDNPNYNNKDKKSNVFNNLINKNKENKENKEIQSKKWIYKGDLKNNKPFGRGKIIYDGIGIFDGEFNGEFHKGKGKINYNDGSTYEGEWENFKRQNYGILQFSNLDQYEGEFKDDLFEGKGRLNLFDKNLIYEGFWRNGKKFGEFTVYNEFEELIKKEKYENDVKIS